MAAIHAAVALPLSVAAMSGLAVPWPSAATPWGHANEMLFGFALAVVAGNQLGPVPRAQLAVLVATWLAARVGSAGLPATPWAIAANIAFAALLALRIAPRLLASVRKLRNRALPLAVAALCAAAIAIQGAPARMSLFLAAIALLGLLMLFMGGRIIAPAAAGQMYRQGADLSTRVQPRLEAAIVACLFAAALAVSLDLRAFAGVAMVLAAGAGFVRLARWRLWKLKGRPDVACLGTGYAWTAAGLAAIGVALLANERVITALHVLTVGAIGTLTINVMALTWARHARCDPAREKLPVVATVWIAAATVARIGADAVAVDRAAWLLVAATCWSVAYLLLLAALSGISRRARRPPAPR